MSKSEDDFREALKGKKIPILTLDNNWHRLFTQTEPTDTIKRLEGELNELLKKQGKMNTETKDIKRIKKKLMDEIVEMMNEIGDGTPSKKVEKQLEEKKRLINECNDKLDEYSDDLIDIPKKIDEVNYALMLETMEVCYEQIKDNSKEIEEITKWIDEIRVELKKKMVRKEQKTRRNQNFYTYMHNIFGSDVINIFDMKYQVEPLKAPQLKEEKTTDNGSGNTESDK